MNKLTLKQHAEGLVLTNDKTQWLMKEKIGYSPVESLVAAIGACGAYVYQSMLDNSQIDYTFHEVQISYMRATEKQGKPLNSVNIDFFVTVSEDDKGRAIRILPFIGRHCPVIQSLDAAIEIKESITFI